MKSRANYYIACLLASAVVLLAQFACSQGADNTATTQPTVSPTPTTDVAAAFSASPAPTAASEPNAAGSSAAASPAATTSGTAPGGAAASHSDAARPAPPRTFTLAAGTPITIYTAKTLSTKNNQDGERFTASLGRAIVDGDWVVAKKGATVEGVIVNSDPGGKVKGRATMTVELRSLQLADGRTVNLDTSSYTKQAKGTKKKDAVKIGVGAGIGAAIGAIAGGGKGAAIGAGVGGGAGTGYVLATRGDPAVIPSETPLTFRLKAPVTVTKQ